MNGGRSEREGDTESETGSRLRAVSTEPDVGLKLTNREIMTHEVMPKISGSWTLNQRKPPRRSETQDV